MLILAESQLVGYLVDPHGALAQHVQGLLNPVLVQQVHKGGVKPGLQLPAEIAGADPQAFRHLIDTHLFLIMLLHELISSLYVWVHAVLCAFKYPPLVIDSQNPVPGYRLDFLILTGVSYLLADFVQRFL